MKESKFEPTHAFLVDEAVRLKSIEKALILKEIRGMLIYKVRSGRDTSVHEHSDGKKYHWVYYSAQALSEKFPYITLETVRRLLLQLEKSGEIVSGIYNKKGYDKTKSYTIPQISMFIPQNGESIPQNGESEPQNGEPIPSLTTSLTTSRDTVFKKTVNPTIKKKPGAQPNSENDIEMVPVDSDGREKPSTAKKQKQPASQDEFRLAEVWVKLVGRAIDLPREQIPMSSFFFVVKKAMKRDKLTYDNVVSLFEFFFQDKNISDDKKVAYQLCLSDSYIAKWRVGSKRQDWNHISAAGEMPL